MLEEEKTLGSGRIIAYLSGASERIVQQRSAGQGSTAQRRGLTGTGLVGTREVRDGEERLCLLTESECVLRFRLRARRL